MPAAEFEIISADHEPEHHACRGQFAEDMEFLSIRKGWKSPNRS